MESGMEVETSRLPSFEQQFASKDKISVSERVVELVDLKPERLRSDVPIVLVGGWGETPQTHRHSLEVIYGEGRRVLSLNIARRGGESKNQREYPEVEFLKAEALLAVLKEKEIAKADLILHSEGAISGLIAATLEPERFRNIVLVDPAGIIGEDRLHRLTGRFLVMLGKYGFQMVSNKDGARSNLWTALKESNKYFAKNPARGVREAQAIANSDIYGILRSLHERGIGISVIHGVDDSVFPMKRVLGGAKENLPLPFVGFYSVKGEHRELSVRPDKYAALAVNALENLARKGQR